jgi:hypothetical protein
MANLEDLQPNASVRGILPDRLVTIVNVQWFGSEALELTYKDPSGRVANVLLYRQDEPHLEIKEIGCWDHRAEELKIQEQAGRINAPLNSQEARRRADDLQARLQRRIEELNLESRISALPPVVLGGMVVVPQGLLMAMKGRTTLQTGQADTQAVAARARAIIMEIERGLGFEPIDREFEKLGYDIESKVPGIGKLRFIEVKGRISGAATLAVTKNEILYSLNPTTVHWQI